MFGVVYNQIKIQYEKIKLELFLVDSHLKIIHSNHHYFFFRKIILFCVIIMTEFISNLWSNEEICKRNGREAN